MKGNSLGFISHSCKKYNHRNGCEVQSLNPTRKWATILSKAIRTSLLNINTSDRGLFTKIDENIYLGAAPITECDIEQLKTLRINAVISLVQSHEAHISPEVYGANSILRIPTPDYHSPTIEQLHTALDFADRNKNVNMFIHCRKGKGRSAVCAVAILAQKHKLSLRNSHMRIHRLRLISSFHSHQWSVVRKMHAYFPAQ